MLPSVSLASFNRRLTKFGSRAVVSNNGVDVLTVEDIENKPLWYQMQIGVFSSEASLSIYSTAMCLYHVYIIRTSFCVCKLATWGLLVLNGTRHKNFFSSENFCSIQN